MLKEVVIFLVVLVAVGVHSSPVKRAECLQSLDSSGSLCCDDIISPGCSCNGMFLCSERMARKKKDDVKEVEREEEENAGINKRGMCFTDGTPTGFLCCDDIRQPGCLCYGMDRCSRIMGKK